MQQDTVVGRDKVKESEIAEYTNHTVKNHWVAGIMNQRSKGEYLTEDGTSKNRVELYNRHAYEYDNFASGDGYTGPAKTAYVMHKYLQDQEGVKILDVGGGTGAVGEELKKLGSYDDVEGVDPAGIMLDVALQKKLYSVVYEQYFGENSGLKSEFYDGVTCCGAFAPCHLPPSSVKEMIKLTKPGGYVVIVMREAYLADDQVSELPSVIQELSRSGRCCILEHYSFDGYCRVGKTIGRLWVLQKADRSG